MSAVLRYRNLRIAIYSNDHPPPHVHVIGPDGEARIAIGNDHAAPHRRYGIFVVWLSDR